jgi:hypothetical protein
MKIMGKSGNMNNQLEITEMYFKQMERQDKDIQQKWLVILDRGSEGDKGKG